MKHTLFLLSLILATRYTFLMFLLIKKEQSFLGGISFIFNLSSYVTQNYRQRFFFWLLLFIEIVPEVESFFVRIHASHWPIIGKLNKVQHTILYGFPINRIRVRCRISKIKIKSTQFVSIQTIIKRLIQLLTRSKQNYGIF